VRLVWLLDGTGGIYFSGWNVRLFAVTAGPSPVATPAAILQSAWMQIFLAGHFLIFPGPGA